MLESTLITRAEVRWSERPQTFSGRRYKCQPGRGQESLQSSQCFRPRLSTSKSLIRTYIEMARGPKFTDATLRFYQHKLGTQTASFEPCASVPILDMFNLKDEIGLGRVMERHVVTTSPSTNFRSKVQKHGCVHSILRAPNKALLSSEQCIATPPWEA